MKALKKEEFDIFELKTRPQDLVVLQNNYVIVAGWDDDLTLYDSNFKVLKSINEINGNLVQPTGLAVNYLTNELFISDIDNHQIITTDFEFNEIKKFGSRGSNNEQFSFPAGLCFCRNNYLYVCDDGNKRIQVFDAELEYLKTVLLDYHPRKIKLSSTVAFIRGYTSGDTTVIFRTYIYDLNDWMLKSQFDHHSFYSCICNISPYYFAIPFKTKLNFYNSDGDVLKAIDLKTKADLSEFYTIGLINLMNNLIVYSQDKRCIRFKL